MKTQHSLRVVFAPYWGEANPYQDALAEHLSASGVEVGKVRSLKMLFRWGVFIDKIPDIVHLHWLPVFGWQGLLALRCIAFVARLVLLRVRGVRIIWTVHNLLPHESRHQRMDWLLARAVVGLSDTLVVHSETARHEVARMWRIKDLRRIAVIPHAHYIDQYRNDVSQAEAHRQLGIPESKIVLLFLGAVRPYKGVMPLIEAFRAQNDERTYMVVAGRPLDEAFSQSVQRAISTCENARFLPGFVEDDDVQVYMNACDVVVLPYRRTLSSGAALLAMSFGKACVAPSQGSLSDVLDPAGAFLYDPEAGDGLLGALRQVVEAADKLAEMGCLNRERVAHWTWAGMARMTKQLYERSVAGAREDAPVERHAVNEKLL
jgi:glycosyltransferase involved in cell wall biosynthesis